MADNTVEARLVAKDAGLTAVLENVMATLQSLDATARRLGEIMLKAVDHASRPIQKVTAAADTVPEEVSTAMEAVDHVTQAANQAADAADSIPEQTHTAMEAANHITQAANQAADSVASIPPEKTISLDAVDNVSAVLDQVNAKLDQTEQNAEETGRGIKGALSFGAGSAIAQKGIDLLSAGFKGLTTDAVGVGQSFEASMSNVAALSGNLPGSDEFNALAAAAKEAGESTQFSASEAADALGYMALAGWDSQKSVETLPAILDLAAASGMDLAAASDTVTDYMSAFSNSLNGAKTEALSAAEMVDIMSYAQANSNTSASQLGEAWKNCAASFNAAGQDVQTTTSFLEALANQGLKGSEAGTAMAAVMRDITNSMENGAIQIGNTSVAVQDEHGNFKDLTEIMQDVEKATQGMGDAEKAAALSATFTADSQKAVNMSLNEGVDKIAGYEKELRTLDVRASDVAKTMNDNLAGDLKSLNSAWEAVQVTIFEGVSPALRSITKIATEVCRWINQLVSGWDAWQASLAGNATDEQKKKLEGMTGVMESIYRVIDFVRGAWNSFVEGFKSSGALDAAMQAIQSIKDAFSSLTSQMGDGSGARGFGEAIGSVAKFISDAISKIAQFDAKTGGLLSKLAMGAAGVKLFGGTFGKLGGLVSSAMGKVSGILGGFKLTNPFSKIPAQAGKSMSATQSKVAQIIGSIGGLFESVGRSISTVFKGIGESIGSMNLMGAASFAVVVAAITASLVALGACREIVIPFLTSLGEIISALVSGVLTALGDFLLHIAGIMPIIAEALVTLTPLVTAIGDAISNIIVAVGEAAAVVIESLTPALQIIGGVITNVVGIIVNGIVAIVQAIVPAAPAFASIAESISLAIQSISQAFTALVQELPGILNGLSELVGTVFDGISQVLESFGTAVKDVGTGIKTVFEGAGTVIESFGNAVSGILDSIAGVIDSIGNACLNAGKGFEKLANGIRMITQLNLFDMGASLAAAAGGVAAMAAAAAGIGDAGDQIFAMGDGLINIAAAGTQAAMVGYQLDALCASMISLGQSAPQMLLAATAMQTMADGATTAFGGLAGSMAILTMVNAQLQMFSAGISSLNMQMTAFGSGAQLVTLGAGTMAASFAPLASAIAMLQAAMIGLPERMAVLGASMMAAMVQMQIAASEGMPAVAAAMIAGCEACIDAAQQTGKKCAAAFGTGMASIQACVASEMNQAAEIVDGACAQMSTIVMATMTTLVKTIQNALRPVPSFVKSIVSQVTAALRAGVGPARSAGSSTGSGYTSGLRSGLSGASGTAAAAVASVISQLSAGKDSAYNSGVWIGQGLVNGMNDMLGPVQRKAAELAKAATDAIHKAAEIGSPSRITTQYGKWIGEGLANGMDRMQSTVQRSADSLMNLASPGALSASLETRGISPRTSGDVVIDIHQEIDGREWAKATHRFTRAEFEKADRIELRLTGG